MPYQIPKGTRISLKVEIDDRSLTDICTYFSFSVAQRIFDLTEDNPELRERGLDRLESVNIIFLDAGGKILSRDLSFRLVLRVDGVAVDCFITFNRPTGWDRDIWKRTFHLSIPGEVETEVTPIPVLRGFTSLDFARAMLKALSEALAERRRGQVTQAVARVDVLKRLAAQE